MGNVTDVTDRPRAVECASSTPPPAQPPDRVQKLLALAHRYRRFVFIAIAILYCCGFNGQWPISRDSALYAAIGRNLYQGHGYTYQGEPHHWVEPALPYLINWSFKLAGPEKFWPVMGTILVCGLASLLMFYHLIRLHAGRPTAVVCVVLFALSEVCFRYCFELYTDTPFLAAILLFLLGYEILWKKPHRTWLGWGLLILASLLLPAIRPAVWIFVAAVVVASAWHSLRGPDRLRHLLVAAVLVGGVITFRAIDPRFAASGAATSGAGLKTSVIEDRMSDLVLNRPGMMIRRSVTEMIPLLLSETLSEAVFAAELGWDWITVSVSLVVVFLGVWLITERPLWGLYVAATLAQMAIHLPRERYFLPILPLLLYAIWQAAAWTGRYLRQPWATIVSTTIVVLLLAANTPRLFGDMIMQRRTPFLEHYDHGRYLKLKNFAMNVPGVVSERDLIISHEDRVLGYFSGRKTLPPISDRRWEATQAEKEDYFRRLASAERLFVLVPESSFEILYDKSRLRIGEPVLTEGNLQLRKATLIPESASPDATPAASSAGQTATSRPAPQPK